MRRCLNLIAILLLTAISFGSCISERQTIPSKQISAQKNIIGEWEGIDDTGKKARMIFDKDGYAKMVRDAEVAGGPGISGEPGLRYQIDYSKDPIALDLIRIDGSGNELDRMPIKVKFISADRIEFVIDGQPIDVETMVKSIGGICKRICSGSP